MLFITEQIHQLSAQFEESSITVPVSILAKSLDLVDSLNVADTFNALAKNGPVYVGSIPSINEVELMVESGLAVPCAVNTNEGYYALTRFGLAVYKHRASIHKARVEECTDVEYTPDLAVQAATETTVKALISIQNCSDAVAFLSNVRWCPINAYAQFWWHSKMCRLGLITQIRRISNGVDPDKVTYAITDTGRAFLEMMDSHVSRFVSTTALSVLSNFEHADAMPLLNSSGSTIAAMKEGLIVKMNPAPQTPDTHSYYQLTSNGIRAREMLLGKGNNK